MHAARLGIELGHLVFFQRVVEGCALKRAFHFLALYVVSGTSFLVPTFLSRPSNSVGKKCWESQIGLDSLVRFGDYKLYSILGVSWSIPGIHARCEARN